MADEFEALLIQEREDKTQSADFVLLRENELMAGDVTVDVRYSTVNYKDGLAVTGRSPVVKRFPMIPGIDFSGTVRHSEDPRYQPGDAVILNGWGVGESHFGGYAGRARVKGDWLVPLPQGLTQADAMAVGTAGYTAMLAVLALERHGINAQSGPVLVTGAAGGVGSMAISFLAARGYAVIASTGRMEEAPYLKSLGAAEVISREELSGPARALGKERWAGVVDSVGSHTLANALSMTRPDGVVTACGLAQGMDLPGSVAPFILRGVTLAGINSVYVPFERRVAAWQRVAQDLDRQKLMAMTRTIGLHDVIEAASDILKGQVRGRLVVAL